MKNIVLLCTSGMSTSLLVSKMRKAAKELNFDCSITAIGECDLRKYEKKADVLLLGPQVKYLSNRLSKKFEGEFPVGLINSSDYGTMNGKNVLKQALELMNNQELVVSNI
ncbi:PTS sugar transporter subunit IIB [Clostridium sp. B9]|uniref:PTS sugar transporter subunit IIB n=1 Tax=Clostridium sp. B9 TaxID=3423224 RepID=UPI003D2F1536